MNLKATLESLSGRLFHRRPRPQSVRDRIGYRTRWTIRKFADDAAFARGESFAEETIYGNVCLNAGIQQMLDLLAGLGGTAYSNANAFLGVGDGGPSNLTSGTVGFTNASAAVVGTSTVFTTDFVANDWLLGTDGVLYQILSITDNTHLTLATTYGGTTQSGFTTQKVLRELATQSALQASTNKKFNAMQATFPSLSGQTLTWESVFASADANFAWREFGVANGSGGTTLLNRKVSSQGQKASGQTWTLQLQITWS